MLKSYISYVLSGSGLTAEERNCTLSDKYEIALTDEDNRRLNDMVSLMESFYLGYEDCKRISETEGRAKGMSEGRAEGLAEGRAEGKIEGRIDALSTCIAVAVRKYGVTIDQAIDDYAVPEDIREEIRRRAEALLKE